MLPIVLGVIGAVMVVVSALALPRLVSDPEAGEPTTTGTRTGVSIQGLRLYPGLASDHTGKDVDYAQSPPAGGMHDPVWLACGVYQDPVRGENAVHDLEHGSVWISYDPDLSGDDVAALAKRLPDNGIMAPYPGLGSPVVLTVWGRQLALDDVDDPRLVTFMEQFGGGEAALEPFVGCQGGTTDPQGRTGSRA